MQSQAPLKLPSMRLDARSVISAGLCVLAPFFDVLGWLLALGGIVLLRRAVFSRRAKWLLVAVAIVPKVLFVVARSLAAPPGLSFPIEPRNLAASSSLWAWSMVLAAFGLFLIFAPRRQHAAQLLVPPSPAASRLNVALGLVPIAVSVVMLGGLTDGFHRIDDAGNGRWALRHALRGNLAVFTGGELTSIQAEERWNSRSGRRYAVRIVLAGGRTFSVTTKATAALDELRKFAATANLPPGAVRILRRNTRPWANGLSGFTLKDCTGTYELAGDGGRSESTIRFWIDGERLAGSETIPGPRGDRVRALRNIKLSDTGAVEFHPDTYFEASQQDKGTRSYSLQWSPGGETGRFLRDGLEIGPRKYRKK